MEESLREENEKESKAFRKKENKCIERKREASTGQFTR